MIKCLKCKAPLHEAYNTEEENRVPCPECGSLGRCFEFTVVEDVKIEDHVLTRFKHIDPSCRGKEKVRVDQISGEQLNRRTGELVQKEWCIDRDNNPPWYFEKITDLGTGEVIRCCDQPLSEHKNRGSAKPEKQGGSQ